MEAVFISAKKTLIIKWLILFACVFAVSGIQSLVLGRLLWRGVNPLLIPLAVACFAMFLGAEGGGVFGLIAGLCWYLMEPGTGAWYIIIMTLAGIVAGMACDQVFNQSMAAALFWSFVSLLLCEGAIFLFMYTVGRLGLGALWSVLLPEIGYSMVFAPLFYWGAKAVYTRLER